MRCSRKNQPLCPTLPPWKCRTTGPAPRRPYSTGPREVWAIWLSAEAISLRAVNQRRYQARRPIAATALVAIGMSSRPVVFTRRVVRSSTYPGVAVGKACRVGRSHDQAQAKQPLHQENQPADDDDLEGGGGGDRRVGLELDLREDVHRQARGVGAGQEEGQVDVAERDVEGEHRARHQARPQEGQRDLEE